MPRKPPTTAATAPTRAPHPVTRSAFARRAGRTPAAITQACRPGGPLEPACIKGTDRIDAAHAASVAWAAKRRIDPEALLDPVLAPVAAPRPVPVTGRRGRGHPKAVEQQPEAPPAGPNEYTTPADVTELLNVTLLEITDRFQSAQGFSDYLDIRRSIAETARVETKNEIVAGRLVSAELVRRHVFGYLQELNTRLLTDVAVTLASRLIPAIRAGATREQVVDTIRRAMTVQLTTTKRRVGAGMRNCKTTDNPPEVQGLLLAPASEEDDATIT